MQGHQCRPMKSVTRDRVLVPPFQGFKWIALDPGAAALRACAWLPSATASRLVSVDSRFTVAEPPRQTSQLTFARGNICLSRYSQIGACFTLV